MEKQITCQNFVMRIYSFVPVVFILAYFEYLILNEILSIRTYFIVSIILMIIFACIYFKCSKKFVLRQLVYNVKQNGICIKINKNEILLDVLKIKNVEIKKIYMYGISVEKLTIRYNFDYKSRVLVFYSEDLIDGQIEGQGLREFYNDLNKIEAGL